jgi:MscS family membrane protein
MPDTPQAAAETAAKTAASPKPDFIGQVTDVWQHGLFGVDIGSILMAIIIFGLFLVLRGIIGKFILKRLADWAIDTKNKVDDKVVPALIPPAQFIPVILGVFFAVQILDLSANQEIFFDRAIKSMIAFTIFWAVYLSAEPISHGFKNLEKLLTPMMMQWIFRVMKVLVVFIGTAVILEIWGIAVGPLLAGLGLFGAAVALGAQDFFKNLIAGMSIISERQFLDGDWILIEGVVEGTVEDIGFRSTTIRRFDKAPIYVPNSVLSDAVVTNFSRMTHRQIKYRFGVMHDTSVKQLKTIRDEIVKFLEDNGIYATRDEAILTVRVDNFTAASIEFSVNCFTKATDYPGWVEGKETLVLKIKEIVEDIAKTNFAAAPPPVTINTLASNDALPQTEKKSAKF